MMNLLAIDTSTEMASLAVQVNGKIVSKTVMGSQQHAMLILPLIAELLNNVAINVSQLDGIVFGKGPGNFTGLRVACSIAKGIAYGQSLPLYPVSSIGTVAYATLLDPQYTLGQDILVMLDARMHQVYWGYFNYPLDSHALHMHEFLNNITDIKLSGETQCCVAGVGWDAYISQLPDAIIAKITQCLLIYPRAEIMLDMVNAGYIASVTANDALPAYIRNQVTHQVG